MSIRPMRTADLHDVVEIEHALFHEPWSRLSFEAELEKAYARCAVMEMDHRIVAYTVCWEIVDELHIANVAVAKSHQRRGLAEEMIRYVMRHSADTCHRAMLEVRRSNHAARQLYMKLGFTETGIRKNYYASEGEDAILMEAVLPR